MKLPILFCAALLAIPAHADTFEVTLGGKTLGQLSYETRGATATLRSSLDNTPLGVFNGTFTGISKGSVASSQFTGDSQSSRKSRIVKVDISEGRAKSVDIAPEDERTDLSDAAVVPPGVRDPIRAMGALFRANGCPTTIDMYDGRRVVQLSPDGQSGDEDALVCNIRYTVKNGPGHLSPLGISSAKMKLNYRVMDGQQQLQELTVSSGVFRLRLTRSD